MPSLSVSTEEPGASGSNAQVTAAPSMAIPGAPQGDPAGVPSSMANARGSMGARDPGTGSPGPVGARDQETGSTAGAGGDPVTDGEPGADGESGTDGDDTAVGTDVPDAASTPPEPLDCGPDGWVVENHGPPANRVNYLILADGYDATTIDTTLEEHIHRMLDARFNREQGEPYGRYRKFVNICVAKVVSETNGIGNGPTAFGGGNGGDRLARVDQRRVTNYINDHIPRSFEVDWTAVVLNQDRWENTGAITMLWSGATRDAPGAALHEGGHGFHQLADEYCAGGTGTRCGPNMCGGQGREYAEVNTTGDCMDTAGKWDLWLGTVQKGLKVPDMGATGLQGTFAGSRYVDSGQYRPSGNSMMNSLFGDDLNTSYNAVSREQIIFSIWRALQPVDSTEPPEGEVTGARSLRVNVIDPDVVDIDWSVDGDLVMEAGGSVFDVTTANLSPGTHTISALAYDNADMDLVRNRSSECPRSVTGRYCHGTAWSRSRQTVSWTVTVE